MCLVLAALLFARLFYRMNLLTIGDFYQRRYGKLVEVMTSVAIVLSYLGWTSAQLTALGLVIDLLSGRGVELKPSIMLGAGVVMVYTLFGGMWSIALTDVFQTAVIVIGLSLIAWLVGDLAGGASNVISHAAADGKLVMFPADIDAAGIWAMAGAFFAFAFGSIPQQDVFQRMTSAKDEDTAVHGTIIGALIDSALRLCRSTLPMQRWLRILHSVNCLPTRMLALCRASCPIWCSAKCRSGRRSCFLAHCCRRFSPPQVVRLSGTDCHVH